MNDADLLNILDLIAIELGHIQAVVPAARGVAMTHDALVKTIEALHKTAATPDDTGKKPTAKSGS